MDELTPVQLQELSDNLKQQQRDIERQIDSLGKGDETVEGAVPSGKIDPTTAMQEKQMTIAQKQRLELRLANISAALARSDANEYGFCVECGDLIGYERLKIKPDSLFCVSCREKQEKDIQ